MQKNVTARIMKATSLIVAAIVGLMQFSIAAPPDYAIDGTTGAPLGGVGAGAVKFCSYTGSFCGVWVTPFALASNTPPMLTNTQLQFFSKKGQNAPVTNLKLASVQTNGRSDDDAVYPLQKANFGTINDISVTLTAFGPWDVSNVDLMCYPYAFYQITLKNTGTSSVDAAVAFQADLSAAAAFIAGKGIKNDDGTLKRAIYVKSDDPQAIISAGPGSDAGFLSSGVCGNTGLGLISKVAAKVTLDAGQTKLIKFVYAWNNDVTGAEGQHDGMFYYLNKFPASGGAGPVADTGLAHFDSFRDNVLYLVAQVRGSNLPNWIKNHLLMTLSNLTNNSMYRKDGRYAHTEGQWATNGTMDQMFHSRQIYAALVPSLNWQELKYWAQTQKTDPMGQIHHDIDSCTDVEDVSKQWSRNMAYMCPWNAKQHHDYRGIDEWVDLNGVYILSVYEAFIATADTVQLSYFWPSVKLAAQRMADQLTSYNRKDIGYSYLYSAGSLNTYDNEAGQDYSVYNNSLAIPTYKAIAILADVKGEAALKTQYLTRFDSTKVQFKRYYITQGNYPGKRKECMMMGPWLCQFLKFGEMLDSASQITAMKELHDTYDPIDSGMGGATYLEWAEYKVAHYAGLCLQIGQYNEWQAMQSDWYGRVLADRNLVYNTPLSIPPKPATPVYLATSYGGYDEYISAPTVWRNYYTIAGFQRNKFSKELWVEPIVPSSIAGLNHTLKDVVVFSPEGASTINFTESGSGFQVQDIYFNPQNELPVSYLYLKDRGLSKNYVKINGVAVDDAKITKIGTGFSKELKIAYQQTVPASGIIITVSDDQNYNSIYTGIRNQNGSALTNRPSFSSTPRSFSIATVASKPYSITIFRLNGTVAGKFSGFGAAKITLGNTQPKVCKLAAGAYLARVAIGNLVINKKFALSR